MISFTREQTYHLYTKAVDMRKDIDSLCGLVREEMGEDRLSGKISWSDFVALTEGVTQRYISIKYLDSVV